MVLHCEPLKRDESIDHMYSLSRKTAEKLTRSEINYISKSAMLVEVDSCVGLPMATKLLTNEIMRAFAMPTLQLIPLAGLTIYLRFIDLHGPTSTLHARSQGEAIVIPWAFPTFFAFAPWWCLLNFCRFVCFDVYA